MDTTPEASNIEGKKQSYAGKAHGQEENVCLDGPSSKPSENSSQRNMKRTHLDAFLYYSNDDIRMNELLNINDDASSSGRLDWRELTGFRRRRRMKEGCSSTSGQQKTCISYEIHSNIVMEIMLQDSEEDAINK